jgi:PAS domain S-box-containing protein
MTLGEDNELKELAALRLRSAAEDQLAASPTAQDPERASAEVLQELRVHQIELEMQNEALRQAKSELEQSRDDYVDLYEFAPVGYLTLSGEGVVTQINLTGAAIFGMERNSLLHRSFAVLVAEADRECWAQHLRDVQAGDGQGHLELRLRRGGGSEFQAQIDCLRHTGRSTRLHLEIGRASCRERVCLYV